MVLKLGEKMTARKTIIWTAVALSFVLVSGCTVQQPRFDGSNQSLRNKSLRSALLRGEIKEALAYYEAEAQRAETNAAWGAAMSAYMQAVTAARFAGQLQKAITYAEKALEIAHKTNVPFLGLARQVSLQPPPLPELAAINHLIKAYQSVRDFDKARVLVDRGLTLLEENPAGPPLTRLSREGHLYAAQGNDLLRLGEYEKAIDALLRAVNLRRRVFFGRSRPGRPRELAENIETALTGSLVDLGRAYRLVGRFDNALESYQEASKHINVGGTRAIHVQEVYLGVGEVYLQQRRFPLALETFQKALSLAEKEQRPVVISSASAGIAAVLRQTGKAMDALPYYQKAIQQTESTRSLLQTEEYRQSYFEGALSAYFGMIDTLSESGNADEAFNISERARSRALLDLLGSKAQLSRFNSSLLDEERGLQERIAAMKVRMAGGDDVVEDRQVLMKDLQEAEQSYSAFLSRVRQENKEQASLMSVEPLTLKQVQELLDPAVSLLEYFVTPNDVLLWVVDKEGVNAVRIPLARKALASKLNALRETISQIGTKERFQVQSEELYKILIEPALPYIKGKELIIVPHDVLHYLPFQVLQSSDGHYLIEKYPIYYLSSASLLQFTQEKRRAMGEKVLALGNPDLGDPKMSLQFAGIEAKEIKSLYPQSTIYLEKEATEEKAKTLSPQNDIIHFASHAELNENDPLASAILLAKSDKEDGRLEVRENFGMDLKASLVVLSACETGLGKLSSGDELVGLTRAFIYAGTPSVVASLWNVEDSSTAQLMASFYKNLKTMTKVEALRQAQLQLIRGNINSDLLVRRGIGGVGKLGEVPAPKSLSPDSVSISTSHPYFWAPFILVGDGK